MENFLDDKAHPDIILLLAKITYSMGCYMSQLNHNAMLSEIGAINAPRYSELFPRIQSYVNSITAVLHGNTPNLSAKVAYEVLFTIQDGMPLLVEVDNYNDTVGAPILNAITGERFSDWLAKEVKV